ncbi:MAG: hypothetical protein IJ725_02155 [Ruminococcus sp.]|nr:hypothetical protein [Ruminococcus sp.]
MNDVRIKNGDIVVYPNGFCENVSGFDEVIQRIEVAASFPKGSFAYDRNLGLFRSAPDFESDNILSTLESFINEALIDTEVYVKVSSTREENGEYYALITVTDGIRGKETEVRVNG